MSIYTFHRTALMESDPYAACMYGLEEHPRYHDCENCDHAKYGNCKYGIHTVNLKILQRGLAECKALLDEVTVKPRPLPP
ncbi:MAG: hypothetical protein IJ521_00235 [Schwartzia sp.]|nr:hypothetical protein [Schwartzia sp. (in: firmicutes)]